MPRPSQGPTELLWIQAFADRDAGPVDGPNGTHFRPMFQAITKSPAMTPANAFSVSDAYGVFFSIYDIGLNKIFTDLSAGDACGTARLSFYPVNSETSPAPNNPPYAIGPNPHQVPRSTYQGTQPGRPVGFTKSWPALSGPVTCRGKDGDSWFGDDLQGNDGYPWFSVSFDQVGNAATSTLGPSEQSWHSSVFQLAGFPGNNAAGAAYRYTLEWTCTPTGEAEPWTFLIDPEMIVRPGT